MDSVLNETIGRERAPAQVTYRLREAITSGLLRPGDRLPQEELANRLGVSRMPIREALSRLEAEGLVVIQPYRGAVVAGLSSAELSEIYEIRIALETLAVRLGVNHLNETTLTAMRTTLETMDSEADSTPWLSLNTKFHTLLYQSSGRALLLEHIENLRNKSDRFLRLFASQRNRTAQAQREHWALFRACEQRNAERASRLLQEHLESTITSLSQSLDDKPDPNATKE